MLYDDLNEWKLLFVSGSDKKMLLGELTLEVAGYWQVSTEVKLLFWQSTLFIRYYYLLDWFCLVFQTLTANKLVGDDRLFVRCWFMACPVKVQWIHRVLILAVVLSLKEASHVSCCYWELLLIYFLFNWWQCDTGVSLRVLCRSASWIHSRFRSGFALLPQFFYL